MNVKTIVTIALIGLLGVGTAAGIFLSDRSQQQEPPSADVQQEEKEEAPVESSSQKEEEQEQSSQETKQQQLAEEFAKEKEEYYLLLANAENPLPQDWSIQTEEVQNGYEMDKRAAPAMREMIQAAKEDGVELMLCSAYRSIEKQQQLFDRYMVSPYVRTRETAATMALPKAKWEENRVLRERSWGEINTITKDEFKNNYARNWNFKNTDPLYWRPPAGESIADVAEDRVHNILTSLSRKSDSESVVMVTHGDFMLALMLTIEDLADEEFLHRADSDDWKITNCTCLHYTRRDPETGRTSKRVRWEQTARPVLDETTGRWEVKVEPWREFKRPYLSNGDLVDVVQAVDPHLLEYYGK